MFKTVCVTILILSIFLLACQTYAASSMTIESLSKIRTAKGYIFKINYSTSDDWTDGLIFKLFCSFSKGVDLSFTSAGLNNIKSGWHKTEIRIPMVYRDRYGYIKDYRVEMYHKGTLIALKSM